MNKIGRNIIVWIIIALIGSVLLQGMQNAQNTLNIQKKSIAYSEFMKDAAKGNIADIIIAGDQITGHYANQSEPFVTQIPPYENVVDRLATTSVKITAQKPKAEEISLLGILISWFPMMLLIGVWLFFMRQMNAKNGGGAMGFGRSKAKLLNEQKTRVTFADVAGIDEARQELEEIVEFLRDPEKFQRLGGRIPKGVLLVGSPGTGKTLTARAVAGEAKVPFFSISGSDFVEMFVGVGASRVRDMFEQGKKNAPCIIFIDEIDAVGRHRGSGMGGGNDEREQTLNQMLVEMDGFEASEGIIIIAATNRPDVLDPALLRPGRFDRQIVVPLPDVNGREQILQVHMKKVPLATNVDSMVIARGTPGFSGADLANLINEAALLAARRGKRVVGMSEFEEAKDKVMMGAERRSLAMSDREKALTAYHEAGHAIVALYEPESDPIHKATIIPRGRALGMVMRLPENDRISIAYDKLKADLAVAMGGRVAEELVFGKDKVTTGASSDIRMATDIARRMVMEWGMSDKMGAIFYGNDDRAGGFVTHKAIAEATASQVDAEVRRLVDEGYARATDLLKTHYDHLDQLAKALLEYETLSGAEIKNLLDGQPIIRSFKSMESAEKPKSTIPTSNGDSGSSVFDV